MRKICALCLSLVVLLGVPATHAQSDVTGYRIGPKDLVAISVIEDANLSAERRVDADGTIELDHVGKVTIAGLTAPEAAAKIEAALEQYLQTATVRVEIKDFRSRPITVIGAVNEPKALPFAGRWSLIEAILEAGGVTEEAGRVIYVVRRADNGLTDRLEIDLKRLLYSADPILNIPVFANDIINVAPAREITVLCMGEVKEPGSLVFQETDRITVLTVLGRAGGRTERASNEIHIKRAAADGAPATFKLSYKKLLDGSQRDLELMDGDIVVVKESFF